MALLNPREEQLFCSLYKEFQSLINYSYKIVHDKVRAEDIVTKCFLKLMGLVIANPQKFPTLQHAKAYLTVMVRNKSFDYVKGKDRVKGSVVPIEEEEMDAAAMEELVHMLEQKEIHKKLFECIDHLPADSKNVIRLFLTEGLKTDGIAQRLGMTSKKVRKAKAAGLKLLRQWMDSKQQSIKAEVLVLLMWTNLLLN